MTNKYTIEHSDDEKAFRVTRVDWEGPLKTTPWFRNEDACDEQGREFTAETMWRGWTGRHKD